MTPRVVLYVTSENMPLLRHQICRLAEEAAATGDPEEALRTLRELRAEIDALERSSVEEALHAGSSFRVVARAMGISRQAAHRRYRDLAPAPAPRVALSSHARRALQLARAQADAMGAPGVAAEHLLLGVLSSGGAAARALEVEGVTADAARASLLSSEGTPARPPSRRDGAVAARALLASAAAIAGALNAPHVEAEHLLLAALSDPDGGATRAITALGVAPAVVRARLGC